MPDYAALAGELSSALPELEIRENEPMSEHCSFRIGGPARLMLLPGSAAQAAAALGMLRRAGAQTLIMGNGTNLLIPDGGYAGAVVCMSRPMSELAALDGGRIRAGAGATLAAAAVFAAERGLSGLEFAHGIPGSLGGGVTMNAGAYGGELCQVVVETRCLTPEGELETVRGAEHAFGYRTSAFADGSRLILGAKLALERGDPAAIRARMDDLAARRREKQPLEWPSAGSTFKRPEGYFAAALIEQCGLKGLRVGGAQVSEKHAGFVINAGGATCADILGLMARVRSEVFARTGVTLEPEVKLLGCTL